MKILFLCCGHYDSGLELFSKLRKRVNAKLVFQIVGDTLVQSVFNIDVTDIPYGINKIQGHRLLDEIERLFEIKREDVFILKYNSHSLRDLKNFTISKNFTKWVKKEEFTHINYYGSSLTWVQQLIFLLKIRKYFTIHDYIPHSGDYVGSGYQYKFYMKVITKIKTHRFILLSKKMRDEFIQYYKVNANSCGQIFFGSFEVYRKFLKHEVYEEPFSILFFGRISPYKGIEYLIEATKLLVKKIPELKVIIAGSGEFYFDIAEIKNDEHFEIHNYYISNEKLTEFISRSSVVVCPYTDATQSGVVMTAYAFNKPIIATDVGSFSEYVIDGETGIIVPPKNSEALAEAIQKLIMDKKLLDYMRNQIKKLKEQRFNWEKSAEELTNIYKGLD